MIFFMKATKRRGDSNGNRLSIPCGIHKPEENFGRAVDRLAEMEFCSLRQAQNRLALFFFNARNPSGDLAR
jgi:hypothetical protein